jgi:hypothetical protein
MILQSKHGVLALLFVLVSSIPLQANAQDGFDDEEVIVFLKKIRDEDRNYLRDVTRSIARDISNSGEFIAKPYKNNSKGAVVEVSPPQFSFETQKSGMSTSEVASMGLSIASDIGSLFGRDKEVQKANEANARLHKNKDVLDKWGDNEKVKVTMSSKVLLLDKQSDREITRTVKYERVFDSKQEFLAEKESIIQSALSAEVKKVLVEFLEDDEF